MKKQKMNNQEFKTYLTTYKHFLKPEFYESLVENADIFSDETKGEIVEGLKEADEQLAKIHDEEIGKRT